MNSFDFCGSHLAHMNILYEKKTHFESVTSKISKFHWTAQLLCYFEHMTHVLIRTYEYRIEIFMC